MGLGAQGVITKVTLDIQPTFLMQNCGQECPLKFSYRIGVSKATPVHLQNESFEFFFHGGILLQNQTSGENNKGCDIGYALAACSREGASNVDARTVTAF